MCVWGGGGGGGGGEQNTARSPTLPKSFMVQGKEVNLPWSPPEKLQGSERVMRQTNFASFHNQIGKALQK